MEITTLCITVFITQLLFIGFRTWNVIATAEKNLKEVIYSGTIVHLTWLICISIGVTSMYEILANFNLSYIPVVLCSLSGGILGSIVAIKYK